MRQAMLDARDVYNLKMLDRTGALNWHQCRMSRIYAYEHLAKVLGIKPGDAQLRIAEAFGFNCYNSFYHWYNDRYPEVDISPVAEAGPHAYCILKIIAARWKQ
jgi:hypothetical protein